MKVEQRARNWSGTVLLKTRKNCVWCRPRRDHRGRVARPVAFLKNLGRDFFATRTLRNFEKNLEKLPGPSLDPGPLLTAISLKLGFGRILPPIFKTLSTFPFLSRTPNLEISLSHQFLQEHLLFFITTIIKGMFHGFFIFFTVLFFLFFTF